MGWAPRPPRSAKPVPPRGPGTIAMASHSGRETEIKLAVADAAAARAILRRAGFQVSRRKVFESNTVFDTPQQTLGFAGALLRVRRAGRVATLTYKGPPAAAAKHKSREELEVEVPAARAAAVGGTPR